MHKKKQKVSQNPLLASITPQRCPYCHPIYASNCKCFADDVIKKKYMSQRDKYRISGGNDDFEDFIFQNYNGGKLEFLADYFVGKGHLKSYLNMEKTKNMIKQAIGGAAKTFPLPVIHFYGPSHKILKLRALARSSSKHRITQQTKPSQNVYSFLKVSQLSECKSKMHQNMSKKQQLKLIDESFCELKALCKQIGIMFKNKNKSQKDINTLKIQLKKTKPTSNSKQKVFKYKLEQNFSIIQDPTKKQLKLVSKSPKKMLRTEASPENIYGLSNKKSVQDFQKNEKKSKVQKSQQTTKRVSTDKAQTTFGSPISKDYANIGNKQKSIKLKTQTLLGRGSRTASKQFKDYIMEFQKNLKKDKEASKSHSKAIKSLQKK